MARTYQSEGRYKFPPLWSAGTEVSCRGQFRIAAMSVTAVLESRVLNSRPVTLLYTYLPCPPPPGLSLPPLPTAASFHSPLPSPRRCLFLFFLPFLPAFLTASSSHRALSFNVCIRVYTHTLREEVRFFSKGTRISGLSPNRTRQSVITKRAHERLVYSRSPLRTEKYLSVNSVFSFSSELNVALPRSIDRNVF